MASCITKIWSGTTAPQVKLTVTLDTATSDQDTAVLDWSLDYVAHGYAANVSTARAYTVKINGTVPTNGSGTFNIDGITGTKNIKSDSVSIAKGTATKNISFSVSFAFNLTWSGVYAGTLTADESIPIPAKTSYSIKYNANGGSGAPSGQTKWYGTALTLSSTKPTRTGYKFSKWNTAANGSGTNYNAGASYTANAAATLYAQWTANTYTVSYNANGGSGAPSSQTKTYGQTLKLQTTIPKRTNYTFLGWSTSAAATTATYAAGANFTANANTTLYAVWKKSYTKPKISSLSATRCNSSGTNSDDGTYAKIKFNWTSTNDVSLITVNWQPATDGVSSETIDTINKNKKGDTVEQVVGNGQFDTETSYEFTVTVTDSGGSTDRSTPMSSVSFHIDVSKNSVAIGKAAENLTDKDGNAEDTFDVDWRLVSRNHLCVGDKRWYHDGNTGIFLSNEGYMHLQRTTAQGYHPYIGFYLDNSTSGEGQIRLNCSDKYMEFRTAQGFRFDDKVVLPNNKFLFINDKNGTERNVFGINDNNNLLIGWDVYDKALGNTITYGNDVAILPKSSGATSAIRPYKRKGDEISISIATAGYVTNSSKDVSFWVPMSVPIIGSPTVTVSSNDGFTLRQGTKYTHGSSATVRVSPASYEVTAHAYNGIYIKAVFNDTTNATNNDAIGINWSGKITLS